MVSRDRACACQVKKYKCFSWYILKCFTWKDSSLWNQTLLGLNQLHHVGGLWSHVLYKLWTSVSSFANYEKIYSPHSFLGPTKTPQVSLNNRDIEFKENITWHQNQNRNGKAKWSSYTQGSLHRKIKENTTLSFIPEKFNVAYKLFPSLKANCWCSGSALERVMSNERHVIKGTTPASW